MIPFYFFWKYWFAIPKNDFWSAKDWARSWRSGAIVVYLVSCIDWPREGCINQSFYSDHNSYLTTRDCTNTSTVTVHCVLKGDLNSKSYILHENDWKYRISAAVMPEFCNFVDIRLNNWDLYCACSVAKLTQDYEIMSAPPHLVHCGVWLSGQPCQQSAPQLLLRDDKRGNIPVLSKFFSITDKLFDLLNIGIESSVF